MSELDFVVLGVGRSGTTALARAINLHPGLFCAHEQAFALDPPGRDAMIARVLGQEDNGDVVVIESQAALRTKLAAGRPFRLGDKLPNYYLYLDSIEGRCPGIRKVFSYRDPVRVALSWDRRARRAQHWPRAKRGIFAPFEHVFCLYLVATGAPDALVVSNKAAFYDDAALMRHVVAHLSPADADGFDAATFEAALFRKRRRPEPGPGAAAYAALWSGLGGDAIDALIDGQGVATAGSLAETLVPFSLSAARPCADFIIRSVRSMGPAWKALALPFGREWMGHYLRFAKLSPGATAMHEAIAELDRFFADPRV